MMSNQILTGDCVTYLPQLPEESVDLVFCDPPFNIGFDYGEDGYADTLSPGDYANWSVLWMTYVYRVLKPTGTFWLAIGDEWAAEMKVMAREVGFHLRSWVIWYYTFGVNSPKKFTRSHAHLFYFTKHKQQFTFNAGAIRVPSARAIVYNDKRANPDGRLPDDTWVLRPQTLPQGFPADGDVWFIPRICGTYKERQEGAANQMPEQLLGRIIRACSNEGELILDPMAGTGTTLATAKKLRREWLGFELVERFAESSRKRVQAVSAGDPLDGPVPQGG